jgi:TolB-like protein/DNA-binding winged helix-turn-helix (wHTH) protein/Tfp pilus assembly protein PilF
VNLQTTETIRFGDFLLDRGAGGLFRFDEHGDTIPVAVGSRALDVLGVLVERRGELVPKQAIMDVVWPGIAVEENNLTVQISTLRRVLDEGRAGASSIQNVPGRGYRFVGPLRPGGRAEPSAGTPAPDAADDDPPATAADGTKPGSAGDATESRHPHVRRGALLVALLAAAAALLLVAAGLGWFRGAADRVDRPRLSIVVLPFENLSGDPKDDYLADGITDDLTSELSYIPDAAIIAHESAYAFKGMAVDLRRIGADLGVRYVLEGSVRRIDTILRVNVQLISAETGLHLWSDRFDEEITDLAAGQEQIVTRMKDGLGISMVEIESARSLRERPTNPDAFDLILRARSIKNLPPTQHRNEEALALFEQALARDPSSVEAMEGVAYFLLETERDDGAWGSYDAMQRAGQLLTRARAIAPNSALVLSGYVYWLRSVNRCPEVIEATQHAIQTTPNQVRSMTGVYNELGICMMQTGHADEDIALQAEANRLNPLSPWKYSRFFQMGRASLLLGQDADAIAFFERSLALNPDANEVKWAYRLLGAAYARSGQMQEARTYTAKADQLLPYDTVRGYAPDSLASPVYVEQVRRTQDALRLAGLRDHADENADFGVPAIRTLQSKVAGYTPTTAPGVTTIRTPDLVRLLADAHPLVIDTATRWWGRSIPGAVGLAFSGLGGSFKDAAQDRLRDKLRALTTGDRGRPIVAVGWNSEHFDGLNLALRLTALGYTRVYWYRGGLEAWEVNGHPETGLALADW